MMDKEWLGKAKVGLYVLSGLVVLYLMGAASDPTQVVSSANVPPLAAMETAVFVVDTNDSGSYREAALTYYQSGDYENAIWYYTHALALDPLNITYYLERGRVYAQAELIPLAVNDYEQCLRLGAAPSDVARAYYELGNIALNQQRFVQALGYLQRAIDLNPQNAEMYYMLAQVYEAAGNWMAAMQTYEQVIAMSPELGYNILIAWGDIARQTEDHEQAITQFTRAISIRPDQTYAYLYRAVSYYALGDSEQSYNDIVSAFEINPADPQVYDFLGWFYNNEGQVALANAYYQRARELNP